MSQYGESFPSSPGGPPGPPAAASGPPPSVRTAVMLIWVSVALGVLGGILGFVMLDSLVDAQVEAQGSANLDRDTLRTAAIVGVVIGVVFAVAFAAFFAYFINKGANWARIVYTVLTGISILFGLFGIATQPPLLLILTVVGWILSIAIIVFLFRPDSNAYFSAPKSRFADGR